MGELLQSLKGNYSAYSYDDLPSNNVGVALYIRFGKQLKEGSDKTIAVISALWFYENKVNITIDSKTTVEKITKKVNGGTNGIKDRKSKFKKAKANIDCK